jgi:hypothetical protein
MFGEDLDKLDLAIARLEGPRVVGTNLKGRPINLDQSPYKPTRNPAQILQLIEKYVVKVVRMNDGSWIAVGPSGRACVGRTLSISVSRAIVEGL